MVEMTPAALVVGGGISGVQASLDLASSGFKVYLVEKAPMIGGKMAQLDKTFPTNDCSMCILAPKLVTAGRHPNIQLITNSELEKVEGEAGNFQVTMLKHPRLVDIEKCTGCGICAQNCPIEVPNEFDVKMGIRKAIYVPFPQAVPLRYTIDKENCLYFQKGTCRICEKFCAANSINFDQKAETISLEVGAIIIATGFDIFDATPMAQYGYGTYDNVLSSLEFEMIVNSTGPTGGKVLLKNGKEPRSVGIIHCIGSRDQNHHPYCSRVCCMYALKFAHLVHDRTKAAIYQFYIDMRAFGKGYEEFYHRAQE
jgi:heterodisulfide reductase subunit A